MDPKRTIDSVIAMYTHNATLSMRPQPVTLEDAPADQALRDPVSHRDEQAEISLIIAVDSTGINNGVWMMRDTAWSHNLLYDWWHSDILADLEHSTIAATSPQCCMPFCTTGRWT
eukprot:SRR837773.16898.p1 GENE.SRR837773.16898~~SRR837773.16898.p1  ORF type:complete len:129 (+),score=7.30 SRR837773.16898:43-387(+)